MRCVHGLRLNTVATHGFSLANVESSTTLALYRTGDR